MERFRRPGGQANLRCVSSNIAPIDRSGTCVAGAFVELVVLMMNQKGMADAVIRQHSDDGTGHCRVCTTGAQTGRYRWPCQTYMAARRAVETAGEAAALEVGPRQSSS
jgi:hypothetical protein